MAYGIFSPRLLVAYTFYGCTCLHVECYGNNLSVIFNTIIIIIFLFLYV